MLTKPFPAEWRISHECLNYRNDARKFIQILKTQMMSRSELQSGFQNAMFFKKFSVDKGRQIIIYGVVCTSANHQIKLQELLEYRNYKQPNKISG